MLEKVKTVTQTTEIKGKSSGIDVVIAFNNKLNEKPQNVAASFAIPKTDAAGLPLNPPETATWVNLNFNQTGAKNINLQGNANLSDIEPIVSDIEAEVKTILNL